MSAAKKLGPAAYKNNGTKMIRALCFGCGLAIALVVLPASAGAFTPHPAPLQVQPASTVHVAYDDARVWKSCRRKVRRAYGPSRGRHASSLRIAFTHQCVMNDGRLV